MGQGAQRKRRRQTASNKATVKQLAFIAAILVLIASAIGLYIAYDDLFEDDGVEVVV
ncbi:hypothetical protein J14TS5_56380 [Paenibacillus lautus]|uniref:hypothetical protein n=1 Tax=Paenibacillus TaxID=44249 RepID=UPI00192A3C14|nr:MULTISPECIES: hypothetical protein [Paenibacillus]GIP00553.1 hypothetical protein J14TS5_56380 [Paenibacillus lautus]